MRRSHLGLILIAALFAVAVACTREVVVEKEVILLMEEVEQT